jgi:hypothetical protein
VDKEVGYICGHSDVVDPLVGLLRLWYAIGKKPRLCGGQVVLLEITALARGGSPGPAALVDCFFCEAKT